MSAPKSGDLVKITKGERVRIGRAEPDEIFGYLWVEGVRVDAGSGEGWTVEVLPEPLPTEPGLYLDVEGDPWRLTFGGKLVLLTPETEEATAPAMTVRPESFAPFRRIEVEG